MNISKKLLSVLLSIVMILSTISCLSMITFAADNNAGTTASSATDLLSAQKTAFAELGAARTNENSEVLAGALSAILSATTVEQVNSIKAQAFIDMAAADAFAKAKTDAIAALNAAKTNDSAYLLYDATRAINKATTIDEVNEIKETTLAAMAKADRDAKKLKLEIIVSHETQKDYYLLEPDTFTDLGGLRINNIDPFNFIFVYGSSGIINFEQLKDEGSGIYAFSLVGGGKITKIEAIPPAGPNPMNLTGENWINTRDAFDREVSIWTNDEGQEVVYFDAHNTCPLRRIDITYIPPTEFEKAQADAINTLYGIRDYENKEIIKEAVKNIKAAKTIDEVNSIKMKAFLEISGNSNPDLDKAKEDAIKAIENAMTSINGPIARAAIANIKCAFDFLEVGRIKDKALADMAMADAEAALEEEKISAIAEITAVQNDYNKKIIETATENINDAANSEEIERIKTQAFADIAKSDSENLSKAKSDAIAELSAYAGDNPSMEVRQYLGLAARNISMAKTISDVIRIKENAKPKITSIEDQVFADYLELAKLSAIAQLEEAAGDKDSRSEKLQWEVETGIFMINLSYSGDMVAEVLNAALGYIEQQKVRDIAISEIKTLCGETPSEAVTAMFDEFCEKIDYAAEDEIGALKAEYTAKITAQIESEKPEDPAKDCSHLCHKDGFLGFIWKIVNIFNKLFGINKVCKCAANHY